VYNTLKRLIIKRKYRISCIIQGIYFKIAQSSRNDLVEVPALLGAVRPIGPPETVWCGPCCTEDGVAIHPARGAVNPAGAAWKGYNEWQCIKNTFKEIQNHQTPKFKLRAHLDLPHEHLKVENPQLWEWNLLKD